MILALFPALVHAESELDSIVDRLQKSYDSIQTIEAKFDQTYRSLRFDDKKMEGEMVVSKPGKMRWDYLVPKGRVLVSDGKWITLYDPDDRQALISAQPKEGGLPVAVSFLAGRGRLKELFKITLKEDKRSTTGEVTLRCEPIRPEPNVAEVDLTLKMGDPVLVTTTKIIDALGGENILAFSDIRVNRSVPAKRFDFKPPKGTPLVSFPTLDVK